MATYRVLRPIEHNHTIYLPAEALQALGGTAPEKLPSGAHGGLVAVNSSGVIELAEKEAEALAADLHGQIPTLNGKPDSIEAAKKREAEAKKKERK